MRLVVPVRNDARPDVAPPERCTAMTASTRGEGDDRQQGEEVGAR